MLSESLLHLGELVILAYENSLSTEADEGKGVLNFINTFFIIIYFLNMLNSVFLSWKKMQCL